MLLHCLGISLHVFLIVVSSGGTADEVIQIPTDLEPDKALSMIDSLYDRGILRQRDMFALKARALNRPGYWTVWGSQAATDFDGALAAFSREPVLSHHDSISFYTLLLDYAHFNARASFAVEAGSHMNPAQTEEDCLKKVLHEAPLDWQTAGAALELGRLNRFRSGPYRMGDGNRYVDAERYLRLVLERYGETGFAHEALWHLAGFLAETGHTEEALQELTYLDRRATGTKWEDRARRLRSTISRREIFVDSVRSNDGRLMIRGQARNIDGELHLQLDRASETGFERTGRLPFAGEDAAWVTALHDQIVIEAGRNGAAWQYAMPTPEAGFYRFSWSHDDTTVVCTIGVWSMGFSETLDDSILTIQSAQNARVVVSVKEEDSSWRIVAARHARAGEFVTCGLPPRRPIQVYLTNGTQCGWSGPKLWAPCFEVWQNGLDTPATDEPGPDEKTMVRKISHLNSAKTGH